MLSLVLLLFLWVSFAIAILAGWTYERLANKTPEDDFEEFMKVLMKR
jgi:hypothetical protein